MKTELKVKGFTNPQELVDFVNSKGITKENIQTLVYDGSAYIIYFWEIQL